MRHPPRPPTESILGAGLWQRVLRIAVVISAVSLGVGTWAHSTGRAWQSVIAAARLDRLPPIAQPRR